MNPENKYMTFAPDLVVEATSVCDRACVGCYAPNVVSRESAQALMVSRPDLFLTPEKLRLALSEVVDLEPSVGLKISFRGGEPTRNPMLSDLLLVAKGFATEIFIETHGRWLLSTSEESLQLLAAAKKARTTIKISFDKMHGLSKENLHQMTTRLDADEIAWCVAVTEVNADEFHATRSLCDWVPDSKIIFQKKAAASEELILPRHGVIKTSGSWANKLSSKWNFRERDYLALRRKVPGLAGLVLGSLLVGSLFSQEAAATDVHIGLASNFSEVSSSNTNPYGDDFRKGVQLAVKDAQSKLKKKNLSIILDEFDYGTSQARVTGAVKQAVDSNVVAVLGYNLSPHALIAAPIHSEAKLAMISSSSTANRLSQIGKYIHLGSFGNEFMGQTLAWVSTKRLKAKRAALIVAEDCAYCTDLADAFASELTRQGGSIVTRIGILDSQKDFSQVILDSQLKAADVIVVPNYELTAVRVVSALLLAGIDKPFLGGDGWGDTGEEFYRMLGGKKVSAFSLSHWHPDLKDIRSTKFKDDYKRLFKKEPNDTSILAYDSMLLLLEAIIRSSTYTREEIEKSLNTIKNFEGVTGKFVYTDPHRAPEKSIVLLTAGEKRFQVVDRLNPHFHRGQK